MAIKHPRFADPTLCDPAPEGQDRRTPERVWRFTEDAEAEIVAAEVEADRRQFVTDEEVSELRALLRQ